jgi:hypothetical protein
MDNFCGVQKVLHSFRKIGAPKIDKYLRVPNELTRFFPNITK